MLSLGDPDQTYGCHKQRLLGSDQGNTKPCHWSRAFNLIHKNGFAYLDQDQNEDVVYETRKADLIPDPNLKFPNKESDPDTDRF